VRAFFTGEYAARCVGGRRADARVGPLSVVTGDRKG
jgi:hypothetical protein